MAFALLALAAVSASADGWCFTGLDAPDLTPLAPDAAEVAFDTELTLVDGSGDSLPVVYEDGKRTEMAAMFLVSLLSEMSGSEVDCYRLPDGATNQFKRCVYIPCPAAGEAFAVKADADGVRFSGRSDFAVYDFCERVLGLRYYWEGPGGRSVLKGERIRIPHLTYSDAPVFSYREYYGYPVREWMRVAKLGGTFDRAARCHSTDIGFCYGSPEGLAEYCRRVDVDIAGGERFARVVDHMRKTVSVSPWDVAYDCKCVWCRTLKGHLVESPGEASPIVWERFLPRLVKHLAERHPDYRVSILPYWNYVYAPKREIDIGTNVQAEVCSMSGLARFKSERVRKVEECIILDWERVTGRKIANWHYSCWPAEYTDAPYVFGTTVAEHYRRMRGHTVGSFICGGKEDFPRLAISMYVWVRCLWNPDIDVGAVYDVFCRRQFGAAAEPMRELLRIQEEEWNPETLNFSWPSVLRMSELMTESAELVRGTSSADALIYYNGGFSGIFHKR